MSINTENMKQVTIPSGRPPQWTNVWCNGQDYLADTLDYFGDTDFTIYIWAKYGEEGRKILADINARIERASRPRPEIDPDLEREVNDLLSEIMKG